MITGAILTVSLLAQYVTAFMAVRLIKVTGSRIAWGLFSLSIAFIAVRRTISLLQFFSGNGRPHAGLTFASVGLISSILMLAGVILITPLFRSMAEEIDRRRKTEEALSRSETKLRDITSSLAEGIYVFEANGHLSFMNPEAERLLGWSIEELNAAGPHELVHFRRPDGTPLPLSECSMHNVIATGKRLFSADEVFVRKDGTVFPISVITSPIVEDGKVVASVTAFQDITERKLAEERIGASLREKEILLKEIHHRVKNNLQIVASMLELQSEYISDSEARMVFEESQKRIETMSLIHARLYRSTDLAGVDFREYIEDLTANLMALDGGRSGSIDLNMDVREVVLDINRAIPCGLIINELFSNVLKHAFKGGRGGRVTVSMYDDGGGKMTLAVSDDGAGFPEGLDFRNTKSLGLQLVVSLVRQLEGTIDLDRSGGTAFRVCFPGISKTVAAGHGK